MENKRDTALALFDSGFNCAQAVIAPFCEEYDLDTETALKLMGGFGAGCRAGELCGAVAAAVAVCGLKYGHHIEGDSGAKANCYARTSQITGLFKEKHGAIVCRELLSGTQTENGLPPASVYSVVCPDFIETAVDILDELGY